MTQYFIYDFIIVCLLHLLQLLATMFDVGFDLNDSVLTAFGDPSTSRLRRVHLRHSSTVTDFGLTALLKVSEPLFLG